MSNISKEDFVILSSMMHGWSIFDAEYTSGHAGCRKPDLSFYRQVLADIGLPAEETVFIDDQQKNIVAAQSLGISAIFALLFVEGRVVCEFIQNSLRLRQTSARTPIKSSLRNGRGKL